MLRTIRIYQESVFGTSTRHLVPGTLYEAHGVDTYRPAMVCFARPQGLPPFADVFEVCYILHFTPGQRRPVRAYVALLALRSPTGSALHTYAKIPCYCCCTSYGVRYDVEPIAHGIDVDSATLGIQGVFERAIIHASPIPEDSAVDKPAYDTGT